MVEKRKNTITCLEKDGTIIEGDTNLREHVTEYYLNYLAQCIMQISKWILISGGMLRDCLNQTMTFCANLSLKQR